MRTPRKHALTEHGGSMLRKAIVAGLAAAAIGLLGPPAGAGAATVEDFAHGGGENDGLITFAVEVRGTPLSATGQFRWGDNGGPPKNRVDADCIVVAGNTAVVAGPENPAVPAGVRVSLTLQDNHATGQPDQADIAHFFGPAHSCTPASPLPLVRGNVVVGTKVTP